MAGKRKDTGIATLPLDLDGSKSNWLLIQTHAPSFARREMPGQHLWQSNPLLQHPETFPTLLNLLYESGLRRSDALIFRPDRIASTEHGGCYTTAQVKTGDDVTVFLPRALVDQLRALPCLKWRGRLDQPGAGMYPFYDGSGCNPGDYLNGYLYKPLKELGQLLGLPGSLRPHRFRDSFAVNKLSLGLSLEDVGRMLGHKDIATTQKYYAPYVLGMQKALEKRVAAAEEKALWAEAQEAASRAAVSVN